MLDFEKGIFVVEIWLLFGRNTCKTLKIHLNPYDSNVRKLFKMFTKTKIISFVFYNIDTHLLASAITNLNDEEFDWFNRNYKLIAKLIPEPRGYSILSENISKDISKTERFYKYFVCKKSDIFIKKGDKKGMLYEI
ncbi:MAG: hypothetical protein HW421_1087 [Ignavibacteria bacterium]|nr:hypothetical protein [Ignavibacteria bacterium]